MRRVTIALVVVGLVVGALFVWKRDSDTRASATTASASPAQRTAAALPAAAPPSLPARSGAAGEPESQPQPVPVDPASAPSLNAPVSEPAPPQKPFTRDETIAKRETDLKLLDDTRTRLEHDLTAARAASDATAVHDLEIRIGRLIGLRKQRAAELDKLRAGGELPK